MTGRGEAVSGGEALFDFGVLGGKKKNNRLGLGFLSTGISAWRWERFALLSKGGARRERGVYYLILIVSMSS